VEVEALLMAGVEGGPTVVLAIMMDVEVVPDDVDLLSRG